MTACVVDTRVKIDAPAQKQKCLQFWSFDTELKVLLAAERVLRIQIEGIMALYGLELTQRNYKV